MDFIEKKERLDQEAETIKKERLSKKSADDIIKDQLTREMMEKYIESVILEKNELVKINWK